MANLSQKPLIFLDLETSGLDPQEHEILEICLMSVSGDVLFYSKIKPTHIETAQPKALEINGYSAEAWADAPTFAEVAETVAGLLDGAVMAGHNPTFDIGFLRAELARVNSDLVRKLGYHLIDTTALAYEHLVGCGLTRLSLVEVCKFLRIALDNAHTAKADTDACRKVYLKLARASWWNRLVWKLRNR